MIVLVIQHSTIKQVTTLIPSPTMARTKNTTGTPLSQALPLLNVTVRNVHDPETSTNTIPSSDESSMDLETQPIGNIPTTLDATTDNTYV